MGIPRARAALVFYRYGCWPPTSSQAGILFFGALPREKRISGTGSSQKGLMGPNRPDPQHMTHFMRDDIVKRAIGVHLGEIRCIELHGAFRWDECSLPGVPRAQMRGTCLPQNTSGAIDRRALR